MTGLGGLNRKPLKDFNKSDSAQKLDTAGGAQVDKEEDSAKESPTNEEKSTAPNSIQTPPKPLLMKSTKTVSHLNNIRERIAAINALNAGKSIANAKPGDNTLVTWQKFFNVEYYKRAAKKHVEKKDGFLIIGDQYSLLVTDESKQVARGQSKKLLPLESGDQFTLEHMAGELLDELPPAQYESGVCFLNLQSNVNKTDYKKERNKKKLFGKKDEEEEEVNPYAPTNGVDLTKIKLDPEDILIFNNKTDHFAYLDAFLSKLLQQHQRHGIRFLYQCVNQLNGNNINGAILADMMGLGKTLQAITLLWVMLKECKYTEVIRAHKAMVVCPSSLIFHWDKELKKWLTGTTQIKHIICFGERRDVINILQRFRDDDSYNLIVLSYDTFRIHGPKIADIGDLLICDEGHKIKNRKIQAAQALNACATKRRVILTGTPIQNSLNEFFTLIDFINPGMFVNYQKFKRVYSDPIQEGQQPFSNVNQKALAQSRMIELNRCSQKFILRRTSELLAKMLPKRSEYILFCKMNEIQKELYRLFVKSEIVKKVLYERNTVDQHIILQLVCFLRKIVNHPRLIYNYVMKNKKGSDEEESSQYSDEELEMTVEEKHRQALERIKEGAAPTEMRDADGKPMPLQAITKKTKEQIEAERKEKREIKARNSAKVKKIWKTNALKIFPPDFDKIDDENLSSKFIIIGNLLKILYPQLQEKIILVSNYTETLSIFEGLCIKRKYPFIRFDGQTKISIRQQLVDQFNAENTPRRRSFVLLLSAKAGGCGLNLIGCNRMVLLDPDWNPSNDQQVMGRIYRVGQLKEVTIFRMYCSNSIEERILEIQRNKENLSDTIIDGKKAQTHAKFSDEVIATLFDYRDDEDEGLESLNAEQLDHIKGALYNLPNVQDYIQFYNLKVTLPPTEIINEFDLTKKGEEIPDSDDDEEEAETAESTQISGVKRPSGATSASKGVPNKFAKK